MFEHVKGGACKLVHVKLVGREMPVADCLSYEFGTLLGNGFVRAIARLGWLVDSDDTIHKVLSHLCADKPCRRASLFSDVSNETTEIIVAKRTMKRVGGACA
jgi:hypothetical protein